MTLTEIKTLPIGNIANKGAHIYLWTTNKMLRKAFEVFDRWGIRFHLVLVMVKPSGIAPAMGFIRILWETDAEVQKNRYIKLVSTSKQKRSA